MSALIALLVMMPLVYVPGWLLARAFTDGAEATDTLERIFERVLFGALLNGWLAFLLAELGIFSIWAQLLLLALVCGGANRRTAEPGALWANRRTKNHRTGEPCVRLPRTKNQEPQDKETRRQGAKETGWQKGKLLQCFNVSMLQCSSAPALQRSSALRSALSALRSITTPILILILLLFAVVVAARPFEVVLGVRDAGVYANSGFAIARTGGISQTDAIVAQIEADQQSTDPALREAAAQAETNLLGVQSRDRTIATRLRQAGFFINEGDMAAGRVIPQGFHLFPAWIALLTSLTGQNGGLAATGLLGLLGLWSVAMLGRRLAGPWVGVVAALLLATNGPQIWFSRYSTAESIAQFLTFAGLYAFAAMIGRASESGDRETETQRRKDAKTQEATEPTNQASKIIQKQAASTQHLIILPTLPALLCGLAIGQLALARIDFILVVAPLLAYLFLIWLLRRWQPMHSWLGIGLFAMLIHAGVHIATIARAYFFDTIFARLQDYALTALVALPFLTPALRERFLLRPCSPIAIQPCPPVAGMPATTFTDWNYARIATELIALALVIAAVFALRQWGQPTMLCVQALLKRQDRVLRSVSALAIGLLGMYAFLLRPQILTPTTLAALPSCLGSAQLRNPHGSCLTLQGYIGAPIIPPAYANPLAAWAGGLTQQLRGKFTPSLKACATLRASILPAATTGLTSVELRAAGLVSEPQIGKAAWDTLQACDRLVLRDLIANSQANLVRVGWYLSPLGILLALIGLAWWWWQMRSDSWMFLVVALIASFFFIRLTYGTSDQHFIYILRRYVPQVYPAMCLGIAYLLGTKRLNASKTDEQGTHSSLQAFVRYGRFGLRLFLVIALLLFNIGTNLKIINHTEYAGALGQLGTIAERFQRQDVLLLRGGAPDFASARDIPDNLATPLTYAYGLNAFTIKSAQPGKYAYQLATYIERWRAEGREVYILAGASGAVGLPGLALEPLADAQLSLPEFEQPTTQKPTNIQEYRLEMRIYRVIPLRDANPSPELASDDYAAQVAGFYRTEVLGDERLAWTDGNALLRLPRPTQGTTLTLMLNPGAARPATLGAPQVCLSYRAEASLWVEDPNATPFSTPECQRLQSSTQQVQIIIDRGTLPTGETILLRIQSDTWIPSRDDPIQHDGRKLGVLFGRIRLR